LIAIAPRECCNSGVRIVPSSGALRRLRGGSIEEVFKDRTGGRVIPECIGDLERIGGEGGRGLEVVAWRDIGSR